MLKTIAIIALCFGLVGCSGTQTPRIAALQKSDKQLSCPQVQLEINEAEFYRKQAASNKSPTLSAIVAPLSYISTYSGASKVQQAANDRIDYLNRIYEISRCDEQLVAGYAPFQPAPVMQQQVAYYGQGYTQVAYQQNQGYGDYYQW